tara:strand:+ start:5593 stop:5826 length:234 start_codon:yes stop_codon:yes gene_type:complete
MEILHEIYHSLTSESLSSCPVVFKNTRHRISELSNIQIICLDIELQMNLDSGINLNEVRKNLRELRPDVELPLMNHV